MGRGNMAPGDPGVVEYAGQAVEERLAAKRFARDALRFRLLDHVRWNRSGQ
jgi:hypothetical protein